MYIRLEYLCLRVSTRSPELEGVTARIWRGLSKTQSRHHPNPESRLSLTRLPLHQNHDTLILDCSGSESIYLSEDEVNGHTSKLFSVRMHIFSGKGTIGQMISALGVLDVTLISRSACFSPLVADSLLDAWGEI